MMVLMSHSNPQQPMVDENPESESDDDDDIPFYQMSFMSNGEIHHRGGMPSPGAMEIAGVLQRFLSSRLSEREQSCAAAIHGPADSIAVAASGNDGGLVASQGGNGYGNGAGKSSNDFEANKAIEANKPSKKSSKANKKKGKKAGGSKGKKNWAATVGCEFLGHVRSMSFWESLSWRTFVELVWRQALVEDKMLRNAWEIWEIVIFNI